MGMGSQNTQSKAPATGKFAGKASATPSKKSKKFNPNSSSLLRSSVKKSVHEALIKMEDGEHMRVSSDAVTVISDMMLDLLNSIAVECNELTLKAQKQTVSANEIITCAALMLEPGSLRDHVIVQLRNSIADEKTTGARGGKRA